MVPSCCAMSVTLPTFSPLKTCRGSRRSAAGAPARARSGTFGLLIKASGRGDRLIQDIKSPPHAVKCHLTDLPRFTNFSRVPTKPTVGPLGGEVGRMSNRSSVGTRGRETMITHDLVQPTWASRSKEEGFTMKETRFIRPHGHYYFVTLCCTLFTLYPALATVTWYGDFQTGTGGTPPNLLQYPTLQCGGTGYNNQPDPPWTCPTLNDGRAFNGPQSTNGIQAPLPGCPGGNASTCRLFFVPSAMTLPPPGVTTPVLQVRLGPNDFSNNGRRNELVGVKEQGA